MSPVIVVASLAAAIVPTVVFLGLVYWADGYEKEPAGLLAAAFFWGAIPSILAAVILNGLLSLPISAFLGPEAAGVAEAALIAPVVEESLKGIALVAILLFRRHDLDSPLDGIVYGAMVGIGFAMVENVTYFLRVYSQEGMEAWAGNIFLRTTVFGLNHALFTSLTGLGIAIARLTHSRPSRIIAPVAGWSAAVLLHVTHNLTAVLGGALCLATLFNAWGGLALVAVIVLWALVQERRWIRQHLADEVDAGTLTSSQYESAYSLRRRFGHNLAILLRSGPGHYRNAVRFYNRCSKLAYMKRRQGIFDEPDADARLEALRVEITQLSKVV